MNNIINIVEELHELMKPYRVCICDEPVEGEVLKNRFTYRCAICMGVIPLKQATP